MLSLLFQISAVEFLAEMKAVDTRQHIYGDCPGIHGDVTCTTHLEDVQVPDNTGHHQRSELLWWHGMVQYDIGQVVVMFWLIGEFSDIEPLFLFTRFRP